MMWWWFTKKTHTPFPTGALFWGQKSSQICKWMSINSTLRGKVPTILSTFPIAYRTYSLDLHEPCNFTKIPTQNGEVGGISNTLDGRTSHPDTSPGDDWWLPLGGEDPTENPIQLPSEIMLKLLFWMGRSTPLMLKRRSADEWLHDHLHYMVPGWGLVWIIDLRGMGGVEMWWLGWSIVCWCLKTYHHKWNLATAKWKNLAKPNSSIKFRCGKFLLRNSGFWKIEKRSQKKSQFTSMACVSESTFFSDLYEPQKPRSSFPGRNLCWCSRGITPWNCTCRTLDSWPLGKEAKTNVTAVTSHFRPWRFPVNLFRFFVRYVFFWLVTWIFSVVLCVFFSRERWRQQ